MFRVLVSMDGVTKSELQDAIDQWVAEHTKWSDDTERSGLVQTTQGAFDDPSTTYRTVSIRFERVHTKDNILQKLGDKLKNKAVWYRVGYHQCTHDEDNPSPCSWDDRRDWSDKNVTIPEYVTDFGV